jgi:hypothetical protein
MGQQLQGSSAFIWIAAQHIFLGEKACARSRGAAGVINTAIARPTESMPRLNTAGFVSTDRAFRRDGWYNERMGARLLAAALFTAIAFLLVVHRTILAGLFAAGLIGRKS